MKKLRILLPGIGLAVLALNSVNTQAQTAQSQQTPEPGQSLTMPAEAIHPMSTAEIEANVNWVSSSSLGLNAWLDEGVVRVRSQDGRSIYSTSNDVRGFVVSPEDGFIAIIYKGNSNGVDIWKGYYFKKVGPEKWERRTDVESLTLIPDASGRVTGITIKTATGLEIHHGIPIPSDFVAPENFQSGPGGIDFNSANLNLQIKRDGHGVPLPISQQDLEHINIDGLIPIIIDIRPATSLPIFSELQTSSNTVNT